MLGTMPQVRAGRLRALGVTSAKRAPSAPDVPAISETVPGYESLQWYGLLAPAATSKDIIAKVHKEAVAVLRLPDVSSRLVNDGAEVVASTPDEFGAFIKAETAKWAKVAKAAGIQPE
jgi:tripartite-type tricarboxylate transporter receptor subunit TctC